MTREENQKVCDDFIKDIDSQFAKFKEETGIDFSIISDYEYESLSKAPMCSKTITVYKRSLFNYSPRIPHNERSCEYIYGDNTLGNPPKVE